ncbi:MAG: SurA N-terminal domain-containing protein [Anaerolineae bacterium]
MQRSFRLLTIPVAAAALALLAACAPAETSASSAAPSTSVAQAFMPTAVPVTALPVDAQGVSVIARVNGQDITLDSFQETLEQREIQAGQIPDVAAFQDMVLTSMIEQVLIEQGAQRLGISVSDAEVDAEIAANRQLAGSDEAWNNWLQTNGYDEASFRASVHEAMLTARVRDSVTAAQQGEVPVVHARHIVVRTEEEANALLQRLNAGEDFGTLAQSESIDESSGRQGGDLGWFAEGELLFPEVARTAFALEPGMVAGPIRSDLGFHLIQTLEKSTRTLEGADLAAVVQSQFERWLTEQFASATIERYL